jgi:ferredoxin-like protein FixX
MAEDRSWIYSGWDKGGNYTDEWMDKATTFLDRAFSRTQIVRCPCRRCQNSKCLKDKRTIAIHLCKNGFVLGYEVWTFHSESSTGVVAEDEHDCDVGDIDWMDEMLEAIQAEVTMDPPTVEVEAFFKLLKALEEQLHEHTEVTLLVFITQLVAIKSKYFFSNNCYNNLLKLVSDILPKPHKVPKDIYQSKKMMSALSLKYEKIDVCPNNCMFFRKEHTNEKKCLECGQSRFIDVVTEDGEKVMTEVTQK